MKKIMSLSLIFLMVCSVMGSIDAYNLYLHENDTISYYGYTYSNRNYSTEQLTANLYFPQNQRTSVSFSRTNSDRFQFIEKQIDNLKADQFRFSSDSLQTITDHINNYTTTTRSISGTFKKDITIII